MGIKGLIDLPKYDRRGCFTSCVTTGKICVRVLCQTVDLGIYLSTIDSFFEYCFYFSKYILWCHMRIVLIAQRVLERPKQHKRNQFNVL